MTPTSGQLLELLQQVDRTPVELLTDDAWSKRIARVDAVHAELVSLSDARIDRDDAHAAEFFVQFTRWTTVSDEAKVAFSLKFSAWGELVCIAQDDNLVDDNDRAALELYPEILSRHGFVPLTYEQLQASYSGEVYDGRFRPDNATWHWRFFEFH